jgi:hypothetical protein
MRGKPRVPTLGGASGAWGHEEVFLARAGGAWPLPPQPGVEALYHFENALTSAWGGPTLVASGTNPPGPHTDAAKFGSYGCKSNGSGLLVTAATPDFAFGEEEFCVEFWVKTAVAGAMSTKAIVTISTTGQYDVGMIWSNGQWLAWYGPNSYFNSDWTYWDTNWHHIALVRHSGVIKLYVDGVRTSGGPSDTTNYSADARISVASCGDGSYAGACYIDELRVTKGSSVYTGNFTPPTAAFADS